MNICSFFTKKYTNKKTRTIAYGNRSQQKRWRFTAKPWHKFMASPAMLCNARGDAMALAVPLSARRHSSSAAAMWPRSRLCSCTMRNKNGASTHFSSQTCLPSSSSSSSSSKKKDIAPNKKNDKTCTFQPTIIDHNVTMIPPAHQFQSMFLFFLGGNRDNRETLETFVLGEDGQVMKGDHGVWMIGAQLFLTAWTEAEMLAPKRS